VITDYDTEQWAAETVGGRRIFNAGFRILPEDLADWRLLKTVPIETSRGAGEFAYMWQREGGGELLRIAVAELVDWSVAQQRLREELQMSMRSDIPRGTGALGHLGDIAFVARDPETDIAAAVTFVRGNAFISVRSVGDRPADVSPAAHRLDRALSRPPEPRELDAQQIEATSIEAHAQEVGEERVVVENIGTTRSGGWLKALASDGELRQRRNSLIYVAPSVGRTRIDMFIRRVRPSPRGSKSHQAS
jgi:hypothetical protein